MKTARYSYFRRYEPLAPSNWRLLPLIALGVFDLWLIVVFIINAWRIWGPR